MAQTSTAVKAERLLNLVIALVNTRRFRPAAWIRQNVAGYGEAPTDEAFSRMFERDKTELRELQVPLETDGEDGYRIPPTEFSLPDLTFSPEETAAVGLAARLWATTGLQSAGEQALRKLREAGGSPRNGAAVDDLPAFKDTVLQPRVRTSDPSFLPLQTATISRRQVRFGYRKQPSDAPEIRRVQPWGLVSFRGRWYLVGHDLDRGGRRTFRLSRIAGDVTATGKAGAYQVPSGIDLLEQVRANAEPTAERSARLLVRPGRAVGLRRGAELIAAAPAGNTGTHDDDPRLDELLIPITGLWDTARMIAAAGADVRVLDPPDLRDAVIRTLRGSRSIGTPRADDPAADGADTTREVAHG